MARQHSPKLKFQIAMEVLRDNKKPSQVAKAYGVHPNGRIQNFGD
jgi:transposase-like protein